MSAKIKDRALDLAIPLTVRPTTHIEAKSLILFDEADLRGYLEFGKSGEVLGNRRAFKHRDKETN